MKFLANIRIMPHAELLDPQGKTVLKNLESIDIKKVEDVRIGKFITVKLEADSVDQAKEKIETSCKKLLANVIMEKYEYDLVTL